MNTEAVGKNFDRPTFEGARQKAWLLLEDISQLAQEGMSETDLKDLTEDKALSLGLERWWHPIKIRFGANTHKSFKELSDPHIRLKEGELFFLDLGPVFDGHEADVGQTYKLGEPAFKNPAYDVFQELKELWQRESLSGEELYHRAKLMAEKRGLVFNLKMAGHRLSDFPHALHHKGSLKDFATLPTPQRWVLEVHLLKKDGSCGYFYEDLL